METVRKSFADGGWGSDSDCRCDRNREPEVSGRIEI